MHQAHMTARRRQTLASYDVQENDRNEMGQFKSRNERWGLATKKQWQPLKTKEMTVKQVTLQYDQSPSMTRQEIYNDSLNPMST